MNTASECARYGFTKWKESYEYENENILDGHQWGLTVLFSDAASLTSHGSNKYPKTWNEMYDVFMHITGENILLLKSDWLNE